jgi:hypothetical protein
MADARNERDVTSTRGAATTGGTGSAKTSPRETVIVGSTNAMMAFFQEKLESKYMREILGRGEAAKNAD